MPISCLSFRRTAGLLRRARILLLERLKTSQAGQWRLIVGGGALVTLVWRAESLPEGWHWWLWYFVSLLVLAGSVLLELYLLGRQEARRRSIEVLEKRLFEASVSENPESRAGERQNLDELLEEELLASHPRPLYLLGVGLLLTSILLAAMSLSRTKACLAPEGGDESVTLRGEVIPEPPGALIGVFLASSAAVLIAGVVARSPVAIGIGTATLAFSSLLTFEPDFNVEIPLSGLEFSFERDELVEAVPPLLEHVDWTAPFRPGEVSRDCNELLQGTNILSTLGQDGVGTVILVGHADERPPRVGGASEEPTNRALAERRAERVADCLREEFDVPPAMLSLGSGPLNLGLGDEALWEKDRRVLVLALRQESVISGENWVKIQVRVKEDSGTATVTGGGFGGGSSGGAGGIRLLAIRSLMEPYYARIPVEK